MRGRHRWGIRAKLLGFYSLAMLALIGLDLAVQVASSRLTREFEVRLSRYHAIHRLRESFDANYERTERRFRENDPPGVDVFGQEMLALWVRFSEMQGAEDESLEAYFNVRAARRGIEAYAKLGESAVRRRSAGDKDYYQDLAAAARIAGYVDSYLSRLLSASLESGELKYRDVVRRSAELRVLSFVGIVLFGVIFAIFAIVFSGSVARPITRLAQASARMASGDLAVDEVEAPTGDEVEVLAHSFNLMSRNLRAMVEDLRGKAELERQLREEERELLAAEKALKEAQFMSLQDQIRPHFLFNALNTIARTALFEEATETERLTHALGRLLRYSLGDAETMVPVREEVAVLREYLGFQALRFGDRLRWEIQVDKGVENFLIPRFTLQPLVENAVRHGIEPMESGGSVLVGVRRREGRVLMRVADTGIGMDRKKARHLISDGGVGIGLANVARRLALRYGGKERISVQSAPGRGTIIRLSLPAETEASR
ncbi:MAG: sensor histidine kinase [Treponemataceae bacterium]